MLDVFLVGAVEGGGCEIDRWDISLRLIFVRLWANSERLGLGLISPMLFLSFFVTAFTAA